MKMFKQQNYFAHLCCLLACRKKNYIGNRYYSTKGSGSSTPLVASYSNPIDFKTVIYKENLKKAGIYRWTNLTNGKIYIGSSSNLGKRFSGYLSSTFLTSLAGPR